MPGVAPIAGWLKVSKVDNGDEVLADVQLYGQELGAEVEGWPTERVREVLKTDHYFHALHLPRAFHIHPLNYALGLAEVAEAAGARIFERHDRALDRCRRRAQAHHHAVRPRACRPYRPRRQRPSRRADAARRRHADADLELCDHHRAARAAPRRGGHLSRRGDGYRSGQQSLPDRRQRSAAVVGAFDHVGGQSAENGVAAASRHRGDLSAARARSRSSMSGRACWAIRCTGCR